MSFGTETWRPGTFFRRAGHHAVAFLIFIACLCGSGYGTLRELRNSDTLTGTHSQIKEEDNFVQLVDVLRGVSPSNFALSKGNVLPILARPRGMAHWSFSTVKDLSEQWFVQPQLPKFAGVRCTHQPSPWIGDYGQFLVSTHIDSLSYSQTVLSQGEYFPHLLRLKLINYCCFSGCATFSFTPSSHGGMMKLAFPPCLGNLRRNVQFSIGKGEISSISNTQITGFSTQASGGIVNSSTFRHHFVGKIQHHRGVNRSDFKVSRSCDDSNMCTGTISWVSPTSLRLDSRSKNETWDEVTVRIGVSFISQDQARLNLKRQLSSDFNSTVFSGEAEWNSMLGRIHVSDSASTDSASTHANKRTFYTNLYRTLLFPRDLAEFDEHNKSIHWSPYDQLGRVFPGSVCTDSGFWDSYRAVYPFLHLVYPEVARTIFRGWTNSFRENSRRMPQWGSPGPRDSMVGSMSDVSIAEAIVNDQIDPDDLEDAYSSLLSSAFNSSAEQPRGTDLRDYIALGYVPEQVALTLNFKLADYAISLAALKMKDFIVSQHLIRRARKWRKLFDRKTQFFRPKHTNGSFLEPFDSYSWKQVTYTEAGPWQYRFYVPFDPSGLANEYDRQPLGNRTYKDQMCKRLKETIEEPPIVHLDNFFHEATELSYVNFGQYAHQNQPSHHILYMFAHAGGDCPLLGQNLITRAREQLYGSFGYSGDEDNGEMSSWFLLSSLGLYSLLPGNGTYQVGSPPLFDKISIRESNSTKVRITIERSTDLYNRTGDQVTASSVSWNCRQYSLSGGPVNIKYRELMMGGRLIFHNHEKASSCP